MSNRIQKHHLCLLLVLGATIGLALLSPHKASVLLDKTNNITECQIISYSYQTHSSCSIAIYSDEDLRNIIGLFDEVSITWHGIRGSYYYADSANPEFRLLLAAGNDVIGDIVVNGQSLYCGIFQYRLSKNDCSYLNEKLNKLMETEQT